MSKKHRSTIVLTDGVCDVAAGSEKARALLAEYRAKSAMRGYWPCSTDELDAFGEANDGTDFSDAGVARDEIDFCGLGTPTENLPEVKAEKKRRTPSKHRGTQTTSSAKRAASGRPLIHMSVATETKQAIKSIAAVDGVTQSAVVDSAIAAYSRGRKKD